MKNSYYLNRLALIALMAFLPMAFLGQADNGQEKAKSGHIPYFYVFGDIGAAWMHADLSQYLNKPDLEYTKLNGRLGMGYQFGGVIGANAKFERGFLGGEKDFLNAKTDYSDYFGGSLNLTFNMMNLFGKYNPDRVFSFVPHIGVGQVQYKAKSVELSTGNVIRYSGFKDNPGLDAGDEGGGLNNRIVALNVPVGADLNFNVSEKWDIYANYTFNFVDTDRLDAYPNWRDDRPIIQGRDMFATLNLGARYKFGGSGIKGMVKNFDLVTLQVIPEVLVERGDSVEVTIRGTFPPKYFAPNAVMNFTPVLQYEGGELALQPISFKGEKVTGDATLISYKNGGSFTYTDKIAYNPGMNVSELVVDPLIYPFKGSIQPSAELVKENETFFVADQRKLADGVIYTSKRIKDSFKGQLTNHKYEKETIITQSANIFFQVNLFNLNWNLPLNKLAENKEALKAVTADVEKGYVIKDVTIAGWASPEGEETFNQGLSGNRSKTAESYMKKAFKDMLKAKDSKVAYANVDDIAFMKSANGPDWNGFMNAVEASNIRDKNAILNVIRSADVAKREQEIRNMILIYPEIEDQILPPLRRSVISVNTFEPKHTDEEIASMSTSNPEALKLNELLYAATLTDDLRTQKMIYAAAMQLHPKCFRAVANAANVEIQIGNLSEAKGLLNKANDMYDASAELHNNMGVVAAMERDFVAAEASFKRSEQLGGDVSYNMGIVNIFKGDYAKATSLMRNTSCDFNLALAQMLNGDNNAAKSSLDCAEQNGAAFYLKAVIGSRTSDKAMMTENLIKAVQADGKYKNEAKNDREFMKYFNDQDFMNIVQ
jgi:outer membrane protein OmpA-like peptidoglycan-associated protein